MDGVALNEELGMENEQLKITKSKVQKSNFKSLIMGFHRIYEK